MIYSKNGAKKIIMQLIMESTEEGTENQWTIKAG